MVWIKSFLLNGFLIAVSVVFTLVLVEVALHYSPLKLKYLYPLEPGGYLQYDKELGFDIQPNFATSTHAFTDLTYPVWSNSMGCFDREYDGVSPYIYITGDSFTWGFTPFEDKWGKIIEKETNIRTLTCGVNAFGTHQELIKTKKDLARLSQAPKYIVVGYFEGNDLGDDYAFPNFTAHKGYRVPNSTRCVSEGAVSTTSTCLVPEPHYSVLQEIKFYLSLNSVSYMMAQRHGLQDKIKNLFKLEQISFPSTKGNEDTAWGANEQSIKEFKELATTYQTRLLFVLIPERETVRAQALPGPDSVHEKVKSILSKEGIEYIDLLPEFRAVEKVPEHLLYWPINEHWNVEGNNLAGEIVSTYLKEKLAI